MRHLQTLACAALVSGATAANAGVIDFENFSNGYDLIAGSPNPISASGLTFTVTGMNIGSDTGIIYDTNDPNNLDPDQTALFTDVDTGALINPGNIAVIGRVNSRGQVDDTNNRGSLVFELSEAVDFVSFRIFDVGDNRGNLDIEYFDAANNLLGSMNVGAGVGDRETQLINFGAGNGEIAKFTFGGSGGIDDIAFRELPAPPVLGLLGLVLAGALRRSRR